MFVYYKLALKSILKDSSRSVLRNGGAISVIRWLSQGAYSETIYTWNQYDVFIWKQASSFYHHILL